MSNCNSILKRKHCSWPVGSRVQTCLTSFRMFLCDYIHLLCGNLKSFLPPWSMLGRLLPPATSFYCFSLNVAVRVESSSSRMWKSARQQADLIDMFLWTSHWGICIFHCDIVVTYLSWLSPLNLGLLPVAQWLSNESFFFPIYYDYIFCYFLDNGRIMHKVFLWEEIRTLSKHISNCPAMT